MTSFEEFQEKIKPEMQRIMELLAKPLSKDGNSLVDQLARVEAWGSRVLGGLLPEANNFLDRAEYAAMMTHREGDMTAGEKQIAIANEVAAERLLRDKIEGLAHSIRNRCSLGQSFLKRLTEESAKHQ